MKTYTIDEVDNSNLLLYKFRRGSHAFGLATETSDIDTGGCFIAPQRALYGIRGHYEMPTEYQKQVASYKNDDVRYEIGSFVELLTKSNPTALEALYAADDCVEYVHPLFQVLRDNKEMFVSKDALISFWKYAASQIRKARGLNKKIVNEVKERKEVLDFCTTFRKQGSTPVRSWLAQRGLLQKYCGLNKVPDMVRMYNCYYDWQEHLHLTWKDGVEMHNAYRNGESKEFFEWLFTSGVLDENPRHLDFQLEETNFINVYKNAIPKGYHGIQREDGTSTDIRKDSILEGDKPICQISYNDDGFQSHCRQYKEYQEWVLKRNKVRYESNLGHNYDAKNISHCLRLLTMALEMAQNKGMILDRRIAGDRDYLLDVKNHKFEYEEVITKADTLEEQLKESLGTCTLPEHVDVDKANELLVKIREAFYNGKTKID
jgi:hypothetical protein